MSRIGKKPIALPEKNKVSAKDGKIICEGPKGRLEFDLPLGVDVVIEENVLSVVPQVDDRKSRATQGLARALIQNAVIGVTEGYVRNLEINGVGYRAEAKGEEIHFALGYSHPIVFDLPKGVTAKTPAPTKIVLEGSDKQVLGMCAANIRDLRPPEPYKGKGIKYAEEIIRRKVGKTGA